MKTKSFHFSSYNKPIWTSAVLIAFTVFIGVCAIPSRGSSSLLSLLVPILLFFMAVVMFIGSCIYKRRYRCMLAMHQCTYCTYDLTGNISGVCSECGTPIPEWQKDKLAIVSDRTPPSSA